jgi:hypothetical protein
MSDSKYRRSLVDPQTGQQGDFDSDALAALRGDDSAGVSTTFTDPITSRLLDDDDDDATAVGGSSTDPTPSTETTATETAVTSESSAVEAVQTASVGAGIALPESRMTGEAPVEPEPSNEGKTDGWSDTDEGPSDSSGTIGESGPDAESGAATISDALDIESVCSACGDGFEVTLPAGVEAARAACPACGELQDLRRPN